MIVKRQTLDDLKKIMATLRGPDGCPWDKQQTPVSLTPYAVEEALELEDAVLHKTSKDVMEELGDLLFQVVFQSRMAEEKGDFTLDDVIHTLSEKMIERHPHVFAGDDSSMRDSASAPLTGAAVAQGWEKNKNKSLSSEQIFTIPKTFPALLSAVKIGKKTRTINFDWMDTVEVFKHFVSEVKELEDAIAHSSAEHQEEELGDVLFTLAQVARHMKVDPETALRKANHKIVDRIYKTHEASGLSWPAFSELDQAEKDKLWERIKGEE
jgi:MazG family protein